jgi:hypothetical protein
MKIKVLSFFLISPVILFMFSGCFKQNETTSSSSATTGTSATTTVTENQKPDMADGFLLIIDYVLTNFRRTEAVKMLAIDTTEVDFITVEENKRIIEGIAKYNLTGLDMTFNDMLAKYGLGFYYYGILLVFRNARLEGNVLTTDFNYTGPYYTDSYGYYGVDFQVTYETNKWTITNKGYEALR